MLQKLGLTPEEIEIKLKEVMNGVNDNINSSRTNHLIESIDINKYDINDLLERPRVSSVPKVNLNSFSDEKKETSKGKKKKGEDSDEEELFGCLMDDKPFYDINLLEYSGELQTYIKEKNRIEHDDVYRKSILEKTALLNMAKTDDEKIKMVKDMNNKKDRGVDESIEVKICDIGNACWFDYHFSTIIQTRQYRAPEVFLGVNYNETTDIWSLACMVFEMVTGDFLFDPRAGDTYSKNDNHLAKFMELLGNMPKNYVKRGCYSYKYFNKNCKLKRIKKLNYVPLKSILIHKYHIKEYEAQALSDFIMPMLEWYPEKRISAQQLLRHPWLTMPANYDYYMSESEIFKMNMLDSLKSKKDKGNNDSLSPKLRMNEGKDVYSSDSELNEADKEDNDKLKDELTDEEDFESGDQNPDKINIPNYNNSFCMYGQFVDLTSLDQPNPQFDKILCELDEEK